ncbi:hypothetical protein A2914_01245 [Candidatus Nomurabacteria bacterium RIFCSPLOWO2_01_FULL_41_21]|uniref:Cohesin domain-containing protein n=2 Tax=Candidatus Nomuraibacteriota TaxID=1752729 RepID=A0A1F6V281_9BACT|nr:MAG: hypothetical protein A2733_02335 [Candidatus Nomurabacteria bacterium RIFCSPHIGHO2_01_FULL_40_20]OGI87937.1 MAG: hypothetical protein A2914_01245 [Candidatus Nomurabacteria bacterium RIFCSPLOWO2_01_FULL_41_21]
MKRYIFFIVLFICLLIPESSFASTLSLSPSAGTFSVGSTFNVSVLLDTKGKSINALQVFLTFPSDKLQVVSPSTGQSIVGVWTAPPKYNNTLGTVSLEGGIPGGIVTSSGVLTTVTFRVKSVGEGIVKFTDKSKVLLDDGLATDDLAQVGNAVFTFRLPPPQGPIVASSTHPDQSFWYQEKSAVLHFANETSGVEGFSYVLNEDPISAPDNISEGTRQSVSYQELSDGIHYFHIKALRDGVWGGTTHFAIKVDTTPPSEFQVELLPNKRTTSLNPIAEFGTTDLNSGIDHYEIKIEPLSREAIQSFGSGNKPIFIEANSPFVLPELAKGSYDVVVHAYDKAGNFREENERLSLTNFTFKIIDKEGIRLGNAVVLPWLWVSIIGGILVLLLAYGAYRTWHWRRHVSQAHQEKVLPGDVLKELDELKKYRERYGAKAIILLLLFSTLFFSGSILAQNTLSVDPPLIDTISRDISNREIFYVGGKTNVSEGSVILYLQNLLTGETLSYEVGSDRNGNWFYRHDGFLFAGEYLIWAQGKDGENFSPPGPQEKIIVEKTAVQFGSNRLSYEVIYLFVIIILGIALIGLALFIIFHYYHGRKKYLEFQREIREAEESIKRGFAILHRDIQAELATIHKMKLSNEFSGEERQREEQLLRDLGDVQKRIGDEIWHIKKETW